MFVRESGAGPVVLLIPGCPMPADHFAALAAALAPTHRVISPDLPGYGNTPPFNDRILERTTELLERVLLDRGITQLAIVGASLGAYRGLALAASGRVRVTALVSLGGCAHLPDEARAAFGQFAAAVRAGHVAALEDVFAARMLSAPFAAAHADIVAEVKQWLYLAPPAVLAAELDAMAALPDLRPYLGDLPTRIAARVGELDVAMPPAYSEALVRAAAHAEVERAPRSGHLLLLEDNEATVASIHRCLAGL